MILFLIRRYNDIDHIVPIVYRMAKDGLSDIEILCLNPTFDIRSDFRLKFLKQNYNIHIDYVYRAFYPTFLHLLIAFLVCSPYFCENKKNITDKQNIFTFLFRRVKRRLFKWGYVRLKEYSRYFGKEWALGMLGKKKPAAIVLDWQRPKFYKVTPLLEAARKLNITIIAVPHGSNLVTNELTTWEDLEKGRDVDYGYEWRHFDFNIVPTRIHKHRLVRGGIKEDTIEVIGSTRYCDEWKKIYEQICFSSKKIEPNPDKKVKVVFMDHYFKYRMNSDSIIDSVKKIAELDFVDFILKPTTRPTGDYRDEDYSRAVSSPKLLNMVHFDYDTPSLALIKWADVVICTTSSICIEVFLQNKILLYPKYFHGNTMLFEEIGACWQVNSYEELENALRKIASEPNYRPYSQKNVEDFITEAVYGGEKGRDVLGKYEEFILAKANTKKAVLTS